MVPEAWQLGNAEAVSQATEPGLEKSQAQVQPTPVSTLQTQAEVQAEAEEELVVLSWGKAVLAEEEAAEKDTAELCAAPEIREEVPDAGSISLPSTEANEGSR